VEQRWSERVRVVIKQSLELHRTAKIEQAFVVLDAAIADAIVEHQGEWILVLCHHAAVLAHAKGDRRREIEYTKQALPHAKDYRFAAYNFAQLLLRDGQVDLAQRYATEAYGLRTASEAEADRNLTAAILKQWPKIAAKALIRSPFHLSC
jgi:hypothetical protein